MSCRRFLLTFSGNSASVSLVAAVGFSWFSNWRKIKTDQSHEQINRDRYSSQYSRDYTYQIIIERYTPSAFSVMVWTLAVKLHESDFHQAEINKLLLNSIVPRCFVDTQNGNHLSVWRNFMIWIWAHGYLFSAFDVLSNNRHRAS